MALDLKSLSAKELRTLIADANAHVAEAHEKEVRDVRSKIDALLAKAGLTLDEVYSSSGQGRKKAVGKIVTRSIAPKYQNPQDAAQQWSGRGRKPLWFVQALRKRGVTAEHLLVGGGAKLEALEKASRASQARKTTAARGTRAKPGRKKTRRATRA